MILLVVPCVSTDLSFDMQFLNADTGPNLNAKLTDRHTHAPNGRPASGLISFARVRTKLGSLGANLTCKIPHRTFDNVQFLHVSDNVRFLLPSSNSQLAHAKEIPTDANALSGVGDFFDGDLRKVTAARLSERQHC